MGFVIASSFVAVAGPANLATSLRQVKKEAGV